MPFVSKSQRRACYARQALDSKSTWDCGEFEAATPKGARLPEHKAPEKSAAITTMQLLDLYSKDEAEWNEADKNLADAFGKEVTARSNEVAARDKTSAAIKAHWPKNLRDLLVDKVGPAKFHAERMDSLKQAAVSELIRTTNSDAAPTGTEVHPPLLSNPYLAADHKSAVDYENGYQHAQEQGHMALSTAPPEQWASWQRNPRPWFEGFTAGASSVGSQPPLTPKVAMLTALEVLTAKTAAVSLPSTPTLRTLVNWAPAIGAGLGAGAGYLSRGEDESGIGSAIAGGLRGAASGTVVRFLGDGIAGPGPKPVSPSPAPAPDVPPTAYPTGSPADRAQLWMQDQINKKASMITAAEVLAAKEAAFPATADFMYKGTSGDRASGKPGTVAKANAYLKEPLGKPTSPAWASPANMERVLGGAKKKSALEVLNTKTL